MRKSKGLAALFGLLGFLLIARPAPALIPALTPLRDLLKQSTFIVAAKVESVDAGKPAMVLIVDKILKGKPSLRKLTVLLDGDAEAKKKKHVPRLLQRVAPRLPLVLFVLQQGKKYTVLAYTNGTWFRIIGVEFGGGLHWSLAHGEPYLRRTFAGSTAELKQIVIDGLMGKKEPPKPNAKEEPGFGPAIQVPKKSGNRGPECAGLLLAVIPHVLVGGPLALSAMLLPVVFGGAMLVLRRWLAALSVLSAISTLYILQDVSLRWLAGSWWATPSALWLAMIVIIVLGILWSWRRQFSRLAVRSSPSSIKIVRGPRKASPNRVELVLLATLSLLCLMLTVFVLPRSLVQLGLWSKMLLSISAGLWTATLHTMYHRWAAVRRSTIRLHLPGEGVLLATMLLVSIAFSMMGLHEPASGEVRADADLHASGYWRYRVAWRFQPQVESCWIASSPRVDGARVYIGVMLPTAFGTSGAVYCVDRRTGKEIWMFNDGGSMKPVFSSPCLADGRFYIGEGLHLNQDCKLYCLDAATGKKLWDFTTASHTESTPGVAAGRVYFGAGDDGLYCLDAATGQPIWHREGWHVDGAPLLIDNRLYGGSGMGAMCKDTELFCLNADTGAVNWRVAVDLPVWGMPAVQGEYIYAGIGNGNFLFRADQLKRADKPAGALLCLERATGKRVWRYDVSDGVYVRPCVDDEHVWFAGRDRHCYCLNRRNGAMCWKADLGSPIVASPYLVGRGASAGLYVATTKGLINRLDPPTGRIEWVFDVGRDTGQPALVLSSPLVQVRGEDQVQSRSIWFGCGLNEFNHGILYCLEESAVSP